MSKKRGLSPIIATVLIILITVSAATFIAGFLIPFVKNQLESTECVNYRDYFSFEDEFGLNCYVKDDGMNTYKMSVRAKAVLNETQQGIKSFGLAFIGQGESIVVIVEDGAIPSDIMMLSDLSSNLVLPESGEVRSYYYNNSKSFDSAEIYPILKSGRKCAVSDRVGLEACY